MTGCYLLYESADGGRAKRKTALRLSSADFVPHIAPENCSPPVTDLCARSHGDAHLRNLIYDVFSIKLIGFILVANQST